MICINFCRIQEDKGEREQRERENQMRENKTIKKSNRKLH